MDEAGASIRGVPELRPAGDKNYAKIHGVIVVFNEELANYIKLSIAGTFSVMFLTNEIGTELQTVLGNIDCTGQKLLAIYRIYQLLCHLFQLASSWVGLGVQYIVSCSGPKRLADCNQKYINDINRQPPKGNPFTQ